MIDSSGRVVERLDLLGPEEEAMARLAAAPRSWPGSSSTVHGEVDPVLEVLLDGGDDGGLALQGQVEDVGVAERPEPHAVAHPCSSTPATRMRLQPGPFAASGPSYP